MSMHPPIRERTLTDQICCRAFEMEKPCGIIHMVEIGLMCDAEPNLDEGLMKRNTKRLEDFEKEISVDRLISLYDIAAREKNVISERAHATINTSMTVNFSFLAVMGAIFGTEFGWAGDEPRKEIILVFLGVSILICCLNWFFLSLTRAHTEQNQNWARVINRLGHSIGRDPHAELYFLRNNGDLPEYYEGNNSGPSSIPTYSRARSAGGFRHLRNISLALLVGWLAIGVFLLTLYLQGRA